jgi:predicted TIM-barrel fold metal-dependent hydrolase
MVVDMDSHVMEPPDLWDTYLEHEYRDRSITVRKAADGVEELVVDNKILMRGRLAALGGVEHLAHELFTSADVPYLAGCPRASYDTAARVALLDEWGVDAGVVFPTIGILWDKPEDPRLAMAYARAYNRWQWDFASPALDRIIPIAHIPLYDVDLALEELRRCLKLGFKGMFLAPEPVGGKRPSHPDFDPLWRELVAADLPVCVHLIVRFDRVVNLSATSWWDPTKEPMNTVFAFALGGTMQLIPATAALVCDGLFDRFPKLKVAMVESGAGYAAYLMDRLDEKYERFGNLIPLKRRPSEYLRENFWFVMDPSERSIDAQCDLLGEDHFMWGSDYPHIDSHADAMSEVHAALAPMSEHRRNLVLGGNAASLFRL